MGIWSRTPVFLRLYNQVPHSKSNKKTHSLFKRYLLTKKTYFVTKSKVLRATSKIPYK